MKLLLAAAAALALLCLPAPAHHTPTHKWLLSWIPPWCCVTNDCCFEIKASDAVPMPEDNWKIAASGQVLKRTDWSADGRWWRCACDVVNGVWTVYATAHTRCIFPVLQSSGLSTKVVQ